MLQIAAVFAVLLGLSAMAGYVAVRLLGRGLPASDRLALMPLTGAALTGLIHDSAAALTVYLDTASSSPSLIDRLGSMAGGSAGPVALLIGPEGGWTGQEVSEMRGRGLTGARLTATILRVETAAVAAAAIVATWRAR